MSNVPELRGLRIQARALGSGNCDDWTKERLETFIEMGGKKREPNDDHVFEVYLRTAEGDTYHRPLREGLKEFLDPEKGYRLTINIEGVTITLRNSWDRDQMQEIDSLLGNQTSVEVCATIRGLDNPEPEDFLTEDDEPSS